MWTIPWRKKRLSLFLLCGIYCVNLHRPEQNNPSLPLSSFPSMPPRTRFGLPWTCSCGKVFHRNDTASRHRRNCLVWRKYQTEEGDKGQVLEEPMDDMNEELEVLRRLVEERDQQIQHYKEVIEEQNSVISDQRQMILQLWEQQEAAHTAHPFPGPSHREIPYGNTHHSASHMMRRGDPAYYPPQHYPSHAMDEVYEEAVQASSLSPDRDHYLPASHSHGSWQRNQVSHGQTRLSPAHSSPPVADLTPKHSSFLPGIDAILRGSAA